MNARDESLTFAEAVAGHDPGRGLDATNGGKRRGCRERTRPCKLRRAALHQTCGE